VRIYAVADIHGKAERSAQMRRQVETLRPDVVVAAGDITNFLHAESVIRELATLPVPVLAVRGNTDLRRVNRLFHERENITGLHLRRTSVMERNFIGVDGTLPIPFRSRVAIREAGLRSALRSLIDGESVFVAHPPPLGVLDTAFGRFNVGSRLVETIVRESKPAVLICGHIHECPGIRTYCETLVVNASMSKRSAGILIDLGDDGSVTAKPVKVDAEIDLP
jgi:Icc-related predicted phosphoesterase